MSRQTHSQLRPGPQGQAVLPLVLQEGLLPVLQGSQTLRSIVTPPQTTGPPPPDTNHWFPAEPHPAEPRPVEPVWPLPHPGAKQKPLLKMEALLTFLTLIYLYFDVCVWFFLIVYRVTFSLITVRVQSVVTGVTVLPRPPAA